ncbi:hypothetical protein BUALT_Bualt16G0022200 [Buddleja alternifolia]|uniref:RRM domain-containing protein n=1 Tax=Buddleja alternifolia TaxID=168488 RepID=A0AAV6W634_9LAMI|nr:hypothetical protein BUALT_Bualt16G0022200 [Buddleja alternifolia]
MAFLNKVGSLLKQTVSKNVNLELLPSNPSLFQAIRSMSSSSKIFVGGLSYDTDEMSLREAFSQHGDVIEARVILDRDTGRSRGFGFVTFTSTEAASTAIQAFDGQDLHGRRISVNYAIERSRGGGFGGGFGTRGGFNYGGQGGNYGGGGGYQGGNYGGSGGRDGNFYGGGYSGTTQYPSGGSGFGGANNYPSGGGSGYGVSENSYGGSDNSNSVSQSGLHSILDDGTTRANDESQEPLGVDEGEDLGQDIVDGNGRDEDDEANDYANKRG